MKFRVPSRQPEQHEPKPEAVPDYPADRPTFAGCICPQPFIGDNGEVYQPHDPNCLVPGHGIVHRRMPPVSVYFQSSRTVGIPSRPRRGIL